MESLTAYTLAAIGAVQGAARYYGPQHPAARAWLALGAGICAYELACPAGETLSEGVDRALESHPLLTTLAIGATALHLLNVLPERLDPFSQALKAMKETAHG